MKIGFDFDRVLFDTDRFNEYLKEETGLHHVDADVYDEHGCYSPEKHAEACGINIEKVYSALEDLNRFLFDDIDRLRELRNNHELVIVTRGEEKLQRKKIKNSGAHRLFDQLFIIQEGPKNVGDIDFLIDDREEEIDDVDVPGMVFDREKQDLEDVIEKISELE